MKPRSAQALALAAVTTIIVASTASAQSPSHHVDLVEGTCAEPGAVVASLLEVVPDAEMSAAPPEMEAVAATLAGPVKRGHSTVPLSLPDIAASGHAVRVMERYRPPGRLVACGEFLGIDRAVADIQVGLIDSDDSGMHGVAWLRDNGDGTTSASIVVAPEVAPPPRIAGADGVEIAISRSLYLPSPLEVAVGTTVTWINEDELPHTATATTPDVPFDSAYMALGDRFSYTFDEPGEFPYFCVFHPRMRAVVVVR